MSNSSKYGRITTSIKEIPEDEPIFLLRAQDPFASDAIEYYARLRLDAGADEEVVIAIEEVAETMRSWSFKKNPD